MALFKIFRGAEPTLNTVPLHEGYAYLCEDTGNLFIDVGINDGDRIQVNAYAASVLRTDGETPTEIDVDDIFLKTMIATVTQGGTGKNTLTANALLIGNGTNPIKMVALENGAIALGSTTAGVTGLKGSGALFALTEGQPAFGILPPECGGTGNNTGNAATATKLATARTVQVNLNSTSAVDFDGTENITPGVTGALDIANGGTNAKTVADAQSNLQVYSKTAVDLKVSSATSVAYTTTLYANAWTASGSTFTYSYSNTQITCGAAGNVPPIITPTSNVEEYSKITDATATPKTGIIFTTSTKPANDIAIIIIDNK